MVMVCLTYKIDMCVLLSNWTTYTFLALMISALQISKTSPTSNLRSNLREISHYLGKEVDVKVGQKISLRQITYSQKIL